MQYRYTFQKCKQMQPVTEKAKSDQKSDQKVTKSVMALTLKTT